MEVDVDVEVGLETGTEEEVLLRMRVEKPYTGGGVLLVGWRVVAP